MSTKNISGSNPLHRDERLSLFIPIPESVDGVKGGEGPNATLPADSDRYYSECPVPQPPSSSVNKALSHCDHNNKVDEEMSIPTPKSSNCSPSTSKRRRSTRLSKPSITKTQRVAKHQVQDPLKLSRQTVLKQSGGDSPLCVKKKMGRRGIQNHIKGIDRKIHCHPDNQKNVLTTVIKEKFNGKGIEANIPVKICSKPLERTEKMTTVVPTSCIDSLPKSEVKQFTCAHRDNTFQPETNGSAQIDIEVGSVQKDIEVIEIPDDADSPIPKVLFEESEDFWNKYLLDTYQQLSSSNPDHQDFEPIPYPFLARGMPVYTENDDTDQVSQVIIHTNTATTKRTQEPSTVSLKDDSDVRENSMDDDNQGQAQSNKAFVGPESWQMNVIKGMLMYLDETNDSPFSKYSIQFNMITKLCTKQHIEGNVKYRHLPGAIFEEIVQTVGGPTFLEIYKNAKMYSQNRRNSMAITKNQPSEYKTNENPSLVQVAVGYGFCMAKSLAKGKQKSASWDHNSVKCAVEHGSQQVLQMSSNSRLKFWKEHILQDGEIELKRL